MLLDSLLDTKWSFGIAVQTGSCLDFDSRLINTYKVEGWR